MKNFIFLLIFILGVSVTTNAQKKVFQKALTPDGKVILLYNDGTWQYDNSTKLTADSLKTTNQSEKNINKGNLSKVSSQNTIILKKGKSEESVFINGPSPKLARYFKTQNIMQCKFQLVSDGKKAVLKTNWRVATGEAFSYFGFINKKCSITFELSEGKVIELHYTGDYDPDEYPKYGFSTYKAEIPINIKQLQELKKVIVTKVTMKWSRRSETYKIVNPTFFIEAIPKISENIK